MRTASLMIALMLSSSVAVADEPAKKAESEQELKALLRRLVPEEAEEAEEAAKTAPAKEAKKGSDKGQNNKTLAGTVKTTPSSEKLAGNVIPFAFGLLIAFGLFTLSNRKKESGNRAIRRIAIEPLGAKQNLMLVEALGEYLLVATGGREPVLLAQLDTEQAKQRLASINSTSTEAPVTASWLSGVAQGLKKLAPNRTPSFDDILDDTPVNIETEKPKKTTSAPAAKLALAQASFKALENEAAPKKKTLNERLAEIAAEESPSKKSESREDRADAIRRRLASL